MPGVIASTAMISTWKKTMGAISEIAVWTSPVRIIFIAMFFSAVILFANSDFSNAQPVTSFTGAYVGESLLDESANLDVIRFLQARIVQNSDYGYYLARHARVLHQKGSPLSIFAYLITCQNGEPQEKYDLGDFYSVTGYYLILIYRDGEEFEIIDEITMMPRELSDRLELPLIPPPPELTANPDEFDFSGPVFNAMDSEVIEWQDELARLNVPRWEFIDLTGDGYLDCVLDIDGFQYQPTCYYIVLAGTEDGFMEGFRSWGYDTDFSEYLGDNSVAITASKYSISAIGEWLPSWRDYYTWESGRFVLANDRFADEYSSIVLSLAQLSTESIENERSENSRWNGMSRYAINATRYSEGIGIPCEYYENLARIAEYNGDVERAKIWWGEIIEYLDEEYDSGEDVDIEKLTPEIRDIVLAYEEWRDELYSASEEALGED